MQVQQNYLLKRYNTFAVEARTKYFSIFSSVEELKEILEDKKNIPSKIILGGGSNILFTKDFDGLVLKNEVPGVQLIHEDTEFVYIQAGAGVKWHDFVLFCIRNDYAGVENLALIPGRVGASPMQNIGAYGVEIKDVFYQLEAVHLWDGEVVTFNADDCEFGYRESIFKKRFRNQFAIVNVTYRLRKIPVFNISYGAIEEELEKMNIADISIQAVADAVIRIRTSKLPDPERIGNAGSFFKNPVISASGLRSVQEHEAAFSDPTTPKMPVFKIGEDQFKIPAGWMIEQCGWKGYRQGDAGCYEKQSLVLVNYGNASGKQIYDLSQRIIGSVKEKFGIELEREVNIL